MHNSDICGGLACTWDACMSGRPAGLCLHLPRARGPIGRVWLFGKDTAPEQLLHERTISSWTDFYSSLNGPQII